MLGTLRAHLIAAVNGPGNLRLGAPACTIISSACFLRPPILHLIADGLVGNEENPFD